MEESSTGSYRHTSEEVMEVTLGMADMKMGNSAHPSKTNYIHKPNRPTVQKNQKSFTQMAQDVMVVE